MFVKVKKYWSKRVEYNMNEYFMKLALDLAKKSNMSGIQEWLSFYFKSPMALPGLDPEHDIFVQLAKLKNTLRHIMGEELITHLGQDK